MRECLSHVAKMDQFLCWLIHAITSENLTLLGLWFFSEENMEMKRLFIGGLYSDIKEDDLRYVES